MPTKKDDSKQIAKYRDYVNDNVFDYEPGIIILPCSNGQPIAVRVHEPYSIRTQRFSATKEQTPPVVPAPDSDQTLISQRVVMPVPKPGSSFPPSYTYTIAGSYTYLETVPSTVTGGFATPRNPWPATFPLLDQAAAALGGSVIGPFTLTPNFTSGTYTWPFAQVGPAFFDETLSTESGS